jgi:penicillin-binding protein 1A
MIPGPGQIVRFCLIASIWLAVIGGGVVAYFGFGLSDKINFEVAAERKPSIRVLSVDGKLLASYGDRYGNPVEVTDLPDYVGNAFVSIEDRRFYSHFGIDPIGIMRAAWSNLMAGHVTEGGSTITQQLAKKPVPVAGTQLSAQGRRSAAVAVAGIQVHQETDFVAVSQPDLFRIGGVWH